MCPVRLVIANDHPVNIWGLQTIMAAYPHLEVVGAAMGGESAIHLVETLRPDVLILDVEMPDMNGIEVVKQLHERNIAVRILILSAYDDAEYIRQLLQHGVAGYILKEEAAETVVCAVEAVARGETGWFSQKVVHHIDRIEQPNPSWKDLSVREIEVLCELALGKTNTGIGRTLQISEKTVEKHIKAIFRKLDVTSRTQAAVVAAQQGLLKENPGQGLE